MDKESELMHASLNNVQQSTLTTLKFLEMAHQDLSDFELLHTRAILGDQLAQLKDAVGRVDMEILHRIESANATTLVSGRYEATRNSASPTLDYARLVTLKEGIMADQDLLECYTPEHEETVTVPEKWSLQKLKKFANKYGDPVGKVLELAKIQGRSFITIRDKEWIV